MYSDLQKRFDSLSAVALELYETAHKLNYKSIESRLQKVWFRLQQGPVRVLVLGVSSAGKSTLINAVVGEFIVPEGKGASTPIPVWITPSAYKDDIINVKILPKSINNIACEDPSIDIFINDYCYSLKSINDKSRRAEYEDLEAAKVGIIEEPFGKQNFTLIDTLGVHIDNEDTDCTQGILDQGFEMIVLVVGDSNVTPDSGIVKFIRPLIDEQNDGDDLIGDSLFILHNPKDQLNGAGTNLQFKHATSNIIGTNINMEHVYVSNLLHARFASIGAPYRYDKTHPPCNPQELKEYGKLYGNEKEMFAEYLELCDELKGEDYTSLKKMLDDISERSEELCEDFESIVSPIENELLECLEALKKKEAEVFIGSDILVPQEMQEALARAKENLQIINTKRSALVMLDEQAKYILDTTKTRLAAKEEDAQNNLYAIVKEANTNAERKNVFKDIFAVKNPSTDLAPFLRGDGWKKGYIEPTIKRFGEYMTKTLNSLEKQTRKDYPDFKEILKDSVKDYIKSAKTADVNYGSFTRECISKINENYTKKMFPSSFSVATISQLDDLAKPLEAVFAKKHNSLNSSGFFGSLKRSWVETNIEIDCYNEVFAVFFRDTLYERVENYKGEKQAYIGYTECAQELHDEFIKLKLTTEFSLHIKEGAFKDEIDTLHKRIKKYKNDIRAQHKKEIDEKYQSINKIIKN